MMTIKPWAEMTVEEKLAFLISTRRLILDQMRREVHTSRSGCGPQLAKVERQIAALRKERTA